MAAPPAVGSEAISEPMNGPLRSTTSEAATTIEAVIAILSSRPKVKSRRHRAHTRKPRKRAP